MKFTFCFGGYWWSQGPWRLQFFFYKEKNGYWRRMYYQPNQWSANESNPIYLKWYWGGASSQTLVLKMKIEWEGKKWVPAEKARAEELSTKTACTLLLPDHSSKNFLYSAVISVKIPKTPRKNQTNCALKKCFHPRRRRRSGHKKERRQTEDSLFFLLLPPIFFLFLTLATGITWREGESWWSWASGANCKTGIDWWDGTSVHGIQSFGSIQSDDCQSIGYDTALHPFLHWRRSNCHLLLLLLPAPWVLLLLLLLPFSLTQDLPTCFPHTHSSKQTNKQSRNYTIPR